MAGLYLYEKLKYDPDTLAFLEELIKYETFLRKLEQKVINERAALKAALESDH